MKIGDFFGELGIRVKRNSLNAATGALKSFEGAFRGSMARMSGAGDRFTASGAGLGGLARGVRASKRQSFDWSKAWQKALVAVGSAWAAFHAVTGFGRMSDSHNAAESRIRLLTDDVERQKRLNEALFQSAQDTGSAFSDVAQLNQQVGKAAVDNGRTLEQGVAIVDTINKAIKASGSEGEAASAALRQLAQGLGSGTLRGEEFNSVIEQAPYLLDIIAKDLGKTRGQMRKLAEGGKLTSKVILGALERQKAAVEEAYGKRIPLMAEGFARLRNRVSRAMGRMMQDKRTAAAFAKALNGIGTALVFLVETGAKVVVFLTEHTKLFYALATAITAATVAAKGFAAAKALGIGASAATGATSAVKGLGASAAGTAGLIGILVGALALLAWHLPEIAELMLAGFLAIDEWWEGFSNRVAKVLKRAFNAVMSFFRAIGREIRAVFQSIVDWLTAKLNWVIDKLNWLIRQINRLPGIDIDTVGRVGANAAPATRDFTPIKRDASAGPSVQTGPISAVFHISGAGDPAAVADASAQKFREMWANEMRTAGDVVG